MVNIPLFVAWIKSFAQIRDLSVQGQAAHQHGIAQWQLVAMVDLPEVQGLAVQAGDFLHCFGLELGPFVVLFRRGLWEREHAGAHLEPVNATTFALLRPASHTRAWGSCTRRR